MLIHPQTKLIREPRPMVPGQKPLGPVKVDRQHPLGRTLQAFVMPQSNIQKSDVVLTAASQTISGATLGVVGQNVVATLSSGYIRNLTIPPVSLPFTLAARFMTTANNTIQRLVHLTKGTSLDTISGFFIGAGNNLIGQHYDGTNDITGNLVFPINTWITAICTFAGSLITLDADNEILTAGMSWTAGPDRLSFGNPDWGAGEAFSGSVEWYGWWAEDMPLASRAMLRADPFQFLIPA